MVTPSLRLAFLKGPRDGETLQYPPGSTIRVGRIVRGNEIAIKDAGISTKHLRIASVSGNWVIQDLGSSNGTLLNSNALDPDTPVDLRHGDIIKLGEYTSIVVNFVIGVQEQKLPPRPRRNNRLRVNADLDPVGLIQMKPAGKRTRASESSDKPSSRVRKCSKIDDSEELGIADGLKEEEFLEEKKGNSRVRFRTRNVASIQSSCVNSIKVEIEDATMEMENSGKRANNSKASRSKNIEIVEKDQTAAEEKRITRATRSKKSEIVEDSHLELEMVLNRARKCCGKNKKAEQKPLKNFEDDEDTDARRQDPSISTVVSNIKSVDIVEVDLGKMTLGEWFSFLEVHLRKQINHETENMIDPMRSKTQRVCEYITEQRKVQAKAFMC